MPAGLSDATAVAAGWAHSPALKSDGTVLAWGRNDSGQTNVPAGLHGVTAIDGGYSHSLAIGHIPPNISVDPLSLATSQLPGTTTEQTRTIGNAGGENLT